MPYYCPNCQKEYEQTSRTYKCLECGESTIYGEKKLCPQCKVVRNTSCCACGCGSCLICNYRFSCMPPLKPEQIKMFNIPYIPYVQYQDLIIFSLEFIEGAGI